MGEGLDLALGETETSEALGAWLLGCVEFEGDGEGGMQGVWGAAGLPYQWGWKAREELCVGDKEKHCVLSSKSLRGRQNPMPWPHLFCFNSRKSFLDFEDIESHFLCVVWCVCLCTGLTHTR